MIKANKVIAIIPARSGSKGLPGKNIKSFCGKPLIAWTIEAGLGSKYINEVVVTTDSIEIAQISKHYGAQVPFIRPLELSGDLISSFSVIKHAIEFYKDELKRQFDYVVLLEPTSPLRTSGDIDNAIEQLMKAKSATAIVGVCKTEAQNPAFLVKKSCKGFLTAYGNSDIKILRRQDIEDVYFFEGSVYISIVKELLERKTFYHQNTLGFEFPKWKSIEIDDIDDFTIAEIFMKRKILNL
jgi:N-acylneuraminate cytidylyltransferase/CMP-N,N'-diacetyllegionaminic acid synthase